MPRMRGRLYSSCASSTWSLPSALRACCAKMSRISCVRSTTRASSASSSARCWVGLELVVGEQHLGAACSRRRCFSSSSFPLPTYVRGSGRARCCTSSPTGLDAGRARELAELAELVVAVGTLREHGDEEPALRLRPGCGIGLARGHCEIMPRYAPAVTALADRLAARTLELVDIPSESGNEEAIREHLARARTGGWTPSIEGDEAFLFAPRAAAGTPLVVLAAHYDTVPAQGNLPGRIEDGAVTGSGRAT